MSYIVFLFISGVIFLSFDNNKFLHISSTFFRILAECNNTVLCNPTILVVIPISFSRFGNLFGVVPSAPTINIIIIIMGNAHWQCQWNLCSLIWWQQASSNFKNLPEDSSRVYYCTLLEFYYLRLNSKVL